MNWLSSHFQALSLDEEHEGYFLGRGASESAIQSFQVKTWGLLSEPSPQKDFRERYGDYGELLQGWVLWPLLSPRGRVLGFAGRRFGEKVVTRYLLPEGSWNPIWTGMTPEVMSRIWAGGDIWIVEGIFDLFPLQWVVPETDVVLASERAHLTDKHVEFLRRFCRGWVHMVYDNDTPGQQGMYDWVDKTGKTRWGGVRRLERVKVRVQVEKYRGKDPGEVWKQGGLAAVRAMFS